MIATRQTPHDWLRAAAAEQYARDPAREAAERRQAAQKAAKKRRGRSNRRIQSALGLVVGVKATCRKASTVPQLTGPEAPHNATIQQALSAIRDLIRQELDEPEPEAGCVLRLASIWADLVAWVGHEATEYGGDGAAEYVNPYTPTGGP